MQLPDTGPTGCFERAFVATRGVLVCESRHSLVTSTLPPVTRLAPVLRSGETQVLCHLGRRGRGLKRNDRSDLSMPVQPMRNREVLVDGVADDLVGESHGIAARARQ